MRRRARECERTRRTDSPLMRLRTRDILFFFFQAEDGIRDVAVTGVQTCALPIFGAADDDVKLKFLRALETSRQFSDVQVDSDVQPATGNGPSSDRVVHLSTFYSGA